MVQVVCKARNGSSSNTKEAPPWRGWSTSQGTRLVLVVVALVFLSTTLLLALQTFSGADVRQMVYVLSQEEESDGNSATESRSKSVVLKVLVELKNSVLSSTNDDNNSSQTWPDQSTRDAVDQLNAVMPLYFKKNTLQQALPRNSIKLIILTKSAPENFRRRSNVRLSWLAVAHQVSSCQYTQGVVCGLHAQLCRHNKLLWFHRFVVGLRNDGSVMQAVADEALQHMDFLWFSGEDQYRRLTWKVLWAIKWMVQHSDVDYIMTADDDSFIYLPVLASWIVSAQRQHLYAGRVPYRNAVVARSQTSKWYVSYDEYPSELYPRYAWGAGMILSFDVAQLVVRLANVSKHWFSVDDAFIGILLNRSGISVTDVPSIHSAPNFHRGCEPGEKQPILVTTNDEEHGFKLAYYAMQHKSLCPLLVRPLYWWISSQLRSRWSMVLLVVFLIMLTLLFTMPCRQPVHFQRVLFHRARSYTSLLTRRKQGSL